MARSIAEDTTHISVAGSKEKRLTGRMLLQRWLGLTVKGVCHKLLGENCHQQSYYLWTLCALLLLARQDGPTGVTVSSLSWGQLTAFFLDLTLAHRREFMASKIIGPRRSP